jgi:hypothetical protein
LFGSACLGPLRLHPLDGTKRMTYAFDLQS